MLVFWLAVYALEILMLTTPVWVLSRYIAPLLVISVGVSSLWLALSLKPVFVAILLLLTAFRILNLLRVIKGRMHRYYLFFATRRTSLYLILCHLAVVFAASLATSLATPGQLLLGTVVLQLLAALVILSTVIKNVAKLRFKMPGTRLADHDLPTITVAIPARNETSDLEECLRTVLASDYPKLEIIVLDDCSHADTAEVIKSFAHAGVRFVQGQEPHQRWLAKNQAYHKLFQEATGQFILFLGVDVRLGPGAIRSMVNFMAARNKSMISLLPRRTEAAKDAVLVQPMRYWWELAPPRKLFNRPPVLSTCWMINKEFLKSLGGFSSVSHSILPEGYFARHAIVNNRYSFIRSSGELQVRTVKNYQEQRDTAIRVKYPQLRRRLENVLFVTVAELLIFVLPVIFVTPFFVQHLGKWTVLPALTIGALVFTHIVIVRVTNPSNIILAALSFPLAVVAELILGYTSVLKYEFGIVSWKDRNVCIPVMHVYPKLPAINDESERHGK
jgi:glycosyltransferase involved in cell wall biosynthesis